MVSKTVSFYILIDVLIHPDAQWSDGPTEIQERPFYPDDQILVKETTDGGWVIHEDTLLELKPIELERLLECVA